MGAFGLHRQLNDGEFSEREKEVFNVICPHVARARRNIDMLKENVTDNERDGVIVLGGKGETLYINPVARRALKGKPASVIPDPGLGAGPAYFKSASGGAYRVRTMPLGKWNNRRNAGKVKLMLLENHPPKGKLSPRLESFGLTAREREVTTLLIQGLSNREIAETLFIAEQTVKDHLQNVYEKMDVGKRTEMIAKVMGYISGDGGGAAQAK